MRILFHNYSNNLSTEPMYLHAALSKSGVDAHLWSNPSVSAFDSFDSVKPDVFVTSYLTINSDIIKYLSQSKIDLVLNVTNVTDAQMSSIEQVLKDNGISTPLLFTNSFSYKPRPKTSLKCERIFPAFDLFLNSKKQQVEETLNELVLSTSMTERLSEFLEKKDVYHLGQVKNVKDLEEPFDFRVTTASLSGLIDLYNHVSIVGDIDFCSSQLFFDAAFKAKGIDVVCYETDKLDSFFTEVFSEDSGDISKQIRNQIKTKHTPFNRASTLLKHLKNKDGVSKVESVKSKLAQALTEL